mmetsp:Transcript_35786/g.143054  ORF Transcript_35786/g.143054 Transcript_35786/m.143054 type:complete len:109 (-) Transcript_35786:1372-1698(-)
MESPSRNWKAYAEVFDTTRTSPQVEAKVVEEQIRLPCRWGGLGFAMRTRIQPVAFHAGWKQSLRENVTESSCLRRLFLDCTSLAGGDIPEITPPLLYDGPQTSFHFNL